MPLVRLLGLLRECDMAMGPGYTSYECKSAKDDMLVRLKDTNKLEPQETSVSITSDSESVSTTEEENEESKCDECTIVQEKQNTRPSVANLALLQGKRVKRSGLFQILNPCTENSKQNTQPVHLQEEKTRPKLRSSPSQRSVIEDMNDSVDPVNFRNCRHCGGVFPYTCARRQALCHAFCSGECYLSYVTLYHTNKRQSR
mmetsp:Transcript_20115/g.33216  ORF Transcript_20115/g.33216 Transcript_20115/m.33216 type:complete len:200 (+) Transcript_20115:222-821(+)